MIQVNGTLIDEKQIIGISQFRVEHSLYDSRAFFTLYLKSYCTEISTHWVASDEKESKEEHARVMMNILYMKGEYLKLEECIVSGSYDLLISDLKENRRKELAQFDKNEALKQLLRIRNKKTATKKAAALKRKPAEKAGNLSLTAGKIKKIK